MHMELHLIHENEDGSAMAELDIDEEAKKYLFKLGFETLLLRYIEQDKNDTSRT